MEPGVKMQKQQGRQNGIIRKQKRSGGERIAFQHKESTACGTEGPVPSCSTRISPSKAGILGRENKDEDDDDNSGAAPAAAATKISADQQQTTGLAR